MHVVTGMVANSIKNPLVVKILFAKQWMEVYLLVFFSVLHQVAVQTSHRSRGELVAEMFNKTAAESPTRDGGNDEQAVLQRMMRRTTCLHFAFSRDNSCCIVIDGI